MRHTNECPSTESRPITIYQYIYIYSSNHHHRTSFAKKTQRASNNPITKSTSAHTQHTRSLLLFTSLFTFSPIPSINPFNGRPNQTPRRLYMHHVGEKCKSKSIYAFFTAQSTTNNTLHYDILNFCTISLFCILADGRVICKLTGCVFLEYGHLWFMVIRRSCAVCKCMM